MNKKGLIIIISGPSGVGKKTIIDQIINDEELNLSYSISMTTRKPRENETHGIDYFFVTEEEFQKAIKENKLIEWAEFASNKYGTPLNSVFDKVSQGKNVILEIEVQGATSVKKFFDKKDYVSIFIIPPSLEELHQRLLKRNTETPEKIRNRLERAKIEMGLQKEYDYVILNDISSRAAQELKSIIKNAIK